MGLDGVFADEEFFGDLTIAQAVGNQLQDLQLAARNPEFAQSRLVQSKELRRRDLPNDDRFLVLSEFESEPDSLMEVTLYVPSAFRTGMWPSRQKIPLFKSLYHVSRWT